MTALWLRITFLALAFTAFTQASAVNFNNEGSTLELINSTYYNNSFEARADTGVFGRDYTGNAVVEMSIGSDKRQNVGDLVRSALYHVIYTKLVELCPDNNDECNTNDPATFEVKWLSNSGNLNPFPRTGHAELKVTSFRFRSNTIRRLLIGSIAGAYEAMTDTERNCFDLTCKKSASKESGECAGEFEPDLGPHSTPLSDNNNRFCSVANRVSVSTAGGHLSIELSSKWHEVRQFSEYHMGAWRCCETREAVDGKLDELKGEMISVFGENANKYRDVQCSGGCRWDEQADMQDVDRVLLDVINHLG